MTWLIRDIDDGGGSAVGVGRETPDYGGECWLLTHATL